MIDLKEAIEKYPQCLESKDKFKAILADVYPERSDKIYIKVLSDVLDCGIAEEIKKKKGKIDSVTLTSYREKIEQTYGYSAKLSIESISLWMKAFGDEKEIEKSISNSENIETVKKAKIHIHEFKESVIERTCNQKGYTLLKCKVCGYEMKKNFTTYGTHLFEKIDEIPPTCISDGEIEYLCSCCKQSKIESIPKVEHKFEKEEITKEATCTEDGLLRKTCKVCGKNVEETIKTQGHNYTEWITQIYATCTEDGLMVRQCQKCGEVEEKTIKSNGHKFGSWQRDENNPDVMFRFCLNCGLEEKEEYDAVKLLKIEKVGDTIEFGNYGGEPIKWKVLDIKDDKALVISEYILDAKPYNEKDVNITWEKCTLRKWLNIGFINEAFTSEEQAKIITTKVTADKNPERFTNPGNNTEDRIFLLSIQEAKKYFKSDKGRRCAPTAYAIKNGVYTSDKYETSKGENTVICWLRSPGYNRNDAACVNCDGSLNGLGNYVNHTRSGVRPVLWINL